jgi:hypothetical protein
VKLEDRLDLYINCLNETNVSARLDENRMRVYLPIKEKEMETFLETIEPLFKFKLEDADFDDILSSVYIDINTKLNIKGVEKIFKENQINIIDIIKN